MFLMEAPKCHISGEKPGLVFWQSCHLPARTPSRLSILMCQDHKLQLVFSPSMIEKANIEPTQISHLNDIV